MRLEKNVNIIKNYNIMKKTLFILRGLPGSGKTTAAEILADTGVCVDFMGNENEKYPVCTADDYFMHDGEYKWNPSQIGFAHESCQNKCREAMFCQEIKIFVANTNTTAKEMAVYYDMAKEYGYQVVSLIVETRHDGKNVHNVSDEALQKMRNRFEIKL